MPNAALRFTPPRTVERKQRTLLTALFSRHPSNGNKKVISNDTKRKQKRVWILRDDKPVAIPVKTGATDGRLTQIVSGKLEPGVAVIIDATRIGK